MNRNVVEGAVLGRSPNPHEKSFLVVSLWLFLALAVGGYLPEEVFSKAPPQTQSRSGRGFAAQRGEDKPQHQLLTAFGSFWQLLAIFTNF